jgi:hypothetical protein
MLMTLYNFSKCVYENLRLELKKLRYLGCFELCNWLYYVASSRCGLYSNTLQNPFKFFVFENKFSIRIF